MTVASIAPATDVPKDALAAGARHRDPEAARTGRQAAAVKITYRVLASTFHDGTRMTPADALYGLGFALPVERAGTPP